MAVAQDLSFVLQVHQESRNIVSSQDILERLFGSESQHGFFAVEEDNLDLLELFGLLAFLTFLSKQIGYELPSYFEFQCAFQFVQEYRRMCKWYPPRYKRALTPMWYIQIARLRQSHNRASEHHMLLVQVIEEYIDWQDWYFHQREEWNLLHRHRGS